MERLNRRRPRVYGLELQLGRKLNDAWIIGIRGGRDGAEVGHLRTAGE